MGKPRESFSLSASAPSGLPWHPAEARCLSSATWVASDQPLAAMPALQPASSVRCLPCGRLRRSSGVLRTASFRAPSEGRGLSSTHCRVRGAASTGVLTPAARSPARRSLRLGREAAPRGSLPDPPVRSPPEGAASAEADLWGSAGSRSAWSVCRLGPGSLRSRHSPDRSGSWSKNYMRTRRVRNPFSGRSFREPGLNFALWAVVFALLASQVVDDRIRRTLLLRSEA